MQATVEMKVVIERSRRLLFSGLRFFRSLPMSRSETWRSSSQARASLSGCGVGRASNGILYFRLDWSYRNRSCISNKQLPWAPDRRRFHSTSIGSDGRILEDNLHPLRDHHISSSAWFVLKRLHASNHLVYLVGGAVRDILLGKQPKDFDVLTSAEPEEVLQCFPGRRAFIVGRSFPVCHVIVPAKQTGSRGQNNIIEVSSFSTNANPRAIPAPPGTTVEFLERKKGIEREESVRTQKKRKKLSKRRGRMEDTIDEKSVHSASVMAGSHDLELFSEQDAFHPTTTTASKEYHSDGTAPESVEGVALGEVGQSVDPTWAMARRENSVKRDFTVNSMQYDPFNRIMYDYCGGVADCYERLLRTVANPDESFSKDPARILRGIRLATRGGLRLETMTGCAMFALGPLVFTLPQGRLQFEISSMMSRGAAAPSMYLLWELGLLDGLLPHHALLLIQDNVSRGIESSSQKKPDLNGWLAPFLELGRDAEGEQSPAEDPPGHAFAVQRHVLHRRHSLKSVSSHVRSGGEHTERKRLEGNERNEPHGPNNNVHVLFHMLSTLDEIARRQEEPLNQVAYIAVFLIPLIAAERQKAFQRSASRSKQNRRGGGEKTSPTSMEASLNDTNTEQIQHLHVNKTCQGGKKLEFQPNEARKRFDRLEGDIDGGPQPPLLDEWAMPQPPPSIEATTTASSTQSMARSKKLDSVQSFEEHVDIIVSKQLCGISSKEHRKLQSANKKLRKRCLKIISDRTGAFKNEEYLHSSKYNINFGSLFCLLPRQPLQTAGRVLVAVDATLESMSAAAVLNATGRRKGRVRRKKDNSAIESIVLQVLTESGVDWNELMHNGIIMD